MRVCHNLSVSFDDPNLVSCAGLIPVMALAERAGLHDLVAAHVRVPGSAGFEPADPGTRTWAATRSCNPARSAKAMTGISPAHDTRFGSSKLAERLWQTRIYRMSFFSVRWNRRQVPSSQVRRTFVRHDPLRTPRSSVDPGSTDGTHAAAACCSTPSCDRQSRASPSPTGRCARPDGPDRRRNRHAEHGSYRPAWTWDDPNCLGVLEVLRREVMSGGIKMETPFVGNRFKDRDEVMTEIGRVLGPGADISVELNNPFEKDLGKILEEAEHFREMLSRWRVVIKVPHTGPVNAENVGQLLTGNKRLDRRWSEPATEDAFRGHNLALMLHEHGFRVNYTLMFDPHQTQLALQARPYFINSFMRHRFIQTTRMATLLDGYAASNDPALLVALRDYMIQTDYLAGTDTDYD